MSSFFDEASLVFIPSGYKTSKAYSVKPTSGDGDLTFTRSNDTASRVASNGLIEKVRTNLTLNSQTGASWTSSGSTIDSTTTADPLGGTDAVQFTALGGVASNIFADNTISITSGTPYAGSVYVKNVDANYVQLTFATATFGSGQYRNFDLTNGTLGGGIGLLGSTIEDVGGGWYRISIAATATASAATGALVVIITPSASASRLQAATAGQTLIAFGIQVEVGDVMTDYIATTTAAVSVGPVANVPRLDYSGGSSCPRLLLEPQRTNLVTFSEQFDNAAWIKSGTTVTANYATSPDGYMNADRIVFAAGAYVFQSISGTYTASIYVKGIAGQVIRFGVGANVGQGALFTFTGEWQRIVNVGSVSTNIILFSTLNGATATDFLVWGAQLEAGAYATSYIPTLGAAVTRGADSASKTSATALIGQTEGTLFAEVEWTVKPEAGSPVISLVSLNNTTNIQNCIILGIERSAGGTNRFYCLVQVSNVTTAALIGSNITNGRYKAALAYKENDFVLYVNGVQIATDTSGAVPTNSQVIVGGRFVGDSFQVSDPISQALVFPTRLSNADLAALTA